MEANWSIVANEIREDVANLQKSMDQQLTDFEQKWKDAVMVFVMSDIDGKVVLKAFINPQPLV